MWTRWGPLVQGIGVKPVDTVLEVQVRIVSYLGTEIND